MLNTSLKPSLSNRELFASIAIYNIDIFVLEPLVTWWRHIVSAMLTNHGWGNDLSDGTKPVSEPKLSYIKINLWDQTSVEL